MRGCHECGALSGVDPLGICNACGKQAFAPSPLLSDAQPGRLTNNAGVRAAAAELRIADLERELAAARLQLSGEKALHNCTTADAEKEARRVDALRAATNLAIAELEQHVLPLCSEEGDIEYAINSALALLKGERKVSAR